LKKRVYLKTRSLTKSAPKSTKPSTALAVRPQRAVVRISDPHRMMPEILSPAGVLGDEAAVGALGLVEVKLTDAEEAILSEPVDPRFVQYKPAKRGGPPTIPYLSHPVYTKWFNRAFGRLGWAIVPKSKPIKNGDVIMCPYMLYIHGQPAAFAWGEQDYFPNNDNQTYGDAVESTVASALRRCAKRLGVGLELWDKEWLASLPRPALPRPAVRRQEPDPDVNYGGTYSKPKDNVEVADEPITREQRARLGVIAERTGRAPADVSLWLKVRYGVASSAKLHRRDYQDVIQALEANGALPLPGDGEA
jgi:hypothetical protein